MAGKSCRRDIKHLKRTHLRQEARGLVGDMQYT